MSFFEGGKFSVSMFPLNLPLTPTHSINIAGLNKGCSCSGYLIELSHVTIENRFY
mgnify:CR=1 FL=1